MSVSFVVGEFELAEGDFLSHPVRPCVWRLGMDVNFISWHKKIHMDKKLNLIIRIIVQCAWIKNALLMFSRVFTHGDII